MQCVERQVRPCEIYQEEFMDCKSLKGRFHQYYINGTSSDCEGWRRDYQNCFKFRKSGDIPAVEAIIASEKERRVQRLQGARQNDVWEYRKVPPKEWHDELPEWTSKRQNTVLAEVQRQREKTGSFLEPDTGRMCVIS
ncbi:UPF0545 protein C22orf39 homolog isoform X2 [Pomacea canaliculata]|uniref:UPF0545 protein C22orf39 homolog isoform X2 n=1 Tax=Pomacea canaliculata TaxID=400727 RepID=UPI000D73DE11|nr:UPF0545 protein C22orf39 homolog isoform X2 [Pomacea canaliculata]